jgi:hypothetical protein
MCLQSRYVEKIYYGILVCAFSSPHADIHVFNFRFGYFFPTAEDCAQDILMIFSLLNQAEVNILHYCHTRLRVALCVMLASLVLRGSHDRHVAIINDTGFCSMM